MAKSSKFLLSVLTCVGLLIVFNYFFGVVINTVTITLTVVIYLFLTTEDPLEWLYVTWKTLPRDCSGIKVITKWHWDLRRFRKSNTNVIKRFGGQMKKHPYRTCFVADGRSWTYKEVDQFSNRVANVFHQAGYVKGDVVALFMESSPEFVCIWLGLAKLGVITALTNYHLRMTSLVHMVTTANSKALVFSTHLGQAVAEVQTLLASGIQLYYYGEDDHGQFTFAKSLMNDMQSIRPTKPPKVVIKPQDPLIYIYTSGTTGLPKAAVVTHQKYFSLTSGIYHSMGLQISDIIYTPLPLYHSSAGITMIGQALFYGITVVVKKKFSASAFWDDCIKHNCTVAQYIGEICRYLLVQPPKPQDRAHSIRLMLGGGLRPKYWQSFVNRFGIAKIGEFYGSTEGNSTLVNLDNTPGAVGFLLRSFPHLLPANLIKADESTGVPLRSKDGLCITCKPGEPGVYVGKILKGSPLIFDGYLDKEATSKKIIRDVFLKGDQAYISGDIMVMDRWGYVYFVDRTGDTFRWKGENVSTTEIEAIISKHIGFTDSAVYGVELPNCEGRAGMAAILDSNHCVDLDQLYTRLAKEIPSYAIPLFIRVTDALPITGTFKLKKLELQSEGFNPAMCGDNELYYLMDSKYLKLTQEAYDDISSGKIRY